MKIVIIAILGLFLCGLLSSCMMACPIPKQQSAIQQYSTPETK